MQKGIRADISLEEKRIDSPFGVEFYIWLPTKDHAAPTLEKLELGVMALRFFKEKAVPCYVHCKNGHGRAPTLGAAYLISEKRMSVDEAVALVTKYRKGAHIEPAQLDSLREFAKRRFA